MRKYKIFFLIFVFCLLSSVFCSLAYANNISVTNALLGAQDTSAHTMIVQFDISQDNAWYDAVNYDAAWVFIKYSTDSGTTWAHATLKVTDANNLTSGIGGVKNPTGFSRGTATYSGASTNVDIDVPTEATSGKKGAFVHLSAAAAGSSTNTLTITGLQFVWDYGTNIGTSSANDATAATATVKVMAIEMVYVPTGTFEAGSSGTGTSEFVKTQINTANATTAPSGSPLAGGYPSGQSAPANASWPNGYSAFYCMKYDVSQGQWVDFFNTLTAGQKTTRDITGGVLNSTGKASQGTVNRNTISWAGGSAAASAGANQYVGCNFLSWADVIAYADWAGLRPMTELEYEKACRGTVPAVADEYAWGSIVYTQVTGITNPGLVNETASNSGNGLMVYGSNANVQGPMRCGFAATSTSTRVQAGASYYGVMELSGNLWKRPVTIGGAFTGLHGDGALDTNGDANNVTGWPGTNAVGAGFRGGAWNDATTFARVSDRYYAALTYINRTDSYGGRCVRTSP